MSVAVIHDTSETLMTVAPMLAACTIARAIVRISPALRRVAGSWLPAKASLGLNALELCRIAMTCTSGATPENPSAAGTAAGGGGGGPPGGAGGSVGPGGTGSSGPGAGPSGAGLACPAGTTTCWWPRGCQLAPSGGGGGGGGGGSCTVTVCGGGGGGGASVVGTVSGWRAWRGGGSGVLPSAGW